MNKFILIIFTAITTLLVGCNPNDYIRDMTSRIAPDDDEAFAQEYISLIKSRDTNAAIQLLDQQYNVPGVDSNLLAIADFLDKGEIISTELIGCNAFSSNQKVRTTLTYQYQFPNDWALVNIIIETIDGHKQVLSLNVDPLPKSLGEINAFTFENKGVLNYIILILAISIPLFMLISLIFCIFSKIRLKGLWIIFIISGFCGLTFNWTTGQTSFTQLNWQLLGAGFFKPGLYAPWNIIISAPVGAILFWVKRKKLMASFEEAKQKTADEISESSQS